jgi:bifunctional enzyme CysN/CysC
VAGGVLKPGDTVTVLPSGFSTTIEAIDGLDGPLAEAYSPMSEVIRLADNLDISRGDMICRPKNMPTVTQDIDAMVAWMINEPLRVGAKLVIKHTTRSARALVKDVQYRLDVNTLHRDESTGELGLNDIGRVRLRTTVPLFIDDYRNNRSTGGFILIDEATNVTVGAGMITDTH